MELSRQAAFFNVILLSPVGAHMCYCYNEQYNSYTGEGVTTTVGSIQQGSPFSTSKYVYVCTFL